MPAGPLSPSPDNPLGGVLGSLIAEGWIAEAPTGQDEAFLLLTTPDPSAPQSMTIIADGIGFTPGSPPPDLVHETPHVELGTDGWAAVVLGGDIRLPRPVSGEWAEIAARTGRVVLVLGTDVKPSTMSVDDYTSRHGHRAAIGLVRVQRVASAAARPGGVTAPMPTSEPARPGGEPALLLQNLFGPYLILGRRYPQRLPPELAPWYCYIIDGGHSIAIAPAKQFQPGGDPAHWLVPAPVTSVLRVGWRVQDGFVIVDLPYDPDSGLVVDNADAEY